MPIMGSTHARNMSSVIYNNLVKELVFVSVCLRTALVQWQKNGEIRDITAR
jgi:hypothetical protein